MKNTLHITTVLDKPEQLTFLVEKLAYRRLDGPSSEQIVPQTGKTLKTSSTETFVCGIVTFDGEGDHVDMPFTTSFLFTCINEKQQEYKLKWALSLS